MDCSTSGFLVHHQLPEFIQTHVHCIGDAIQPSHPLSSPSPPTFNLYQQQRFFQCVSFGIRWPKDWRFSFSSSPSNEYSALISFRMNWLDLLAVQDSQESSPTPQFKSINCLALSFLYSLSHPYMTTGKTIADKVRRTFAGKVMSLLFNMLSRLVITFLPRSKHLLVSWLQSPSAVILESPKLNTFTELKQDLKWALGSMATNNASEGDGNPVELFQIL